MGSHRRVCYRRSPLSLNAPSGPVPPVDPRRLGVRGAEERSTSRSRCRLFARDSLHRRTRATCRCPSRKARPFPFRPSPSQSHPTTGRAQVMMAGPGPAVHVDADAGMVCRNGHSMARLAPCHGGASGPLARLHRPAHLPGKTGRSSNGREDISFSDTTHREIYCVWVMTPCFT